VEAAEKADSLGVDIINTSLGYFEFDNTYNHTYSDGWITTFISRGAEIAFSRGMIVALQAMKEVLLILISSASRCSFSISYWRS
jgi:hypothetical protein